MMSQSPMTHITEDTMELYAMKRLPEAETEAVEEHLLLCEVCQDLLERTEEFVDTIRVASREISNEAKAQPAPRERWWKGLFHIPMPVLAAAACAMLALVVLVPRNSPTATVELRAMRGAETPVLAPANAALNLRLSLEGLDEPDNLSIQVANAAGEIVAEAPATRASDAGLAFAKISKLRAGAYWVRLHSEGELVREYGLTVR